LLILSLDTSSAAGSAALVRDGAVLVERAGDGSRTHGERLPRELMAILDEAGAGLDDVDRFAVSIGPGSFTGLRVGIATIQGLAMARRALVTPVSSFEALAWRARGTADAIAAWIDAHRGEVFACLYDAGGRVVLREPTSLSPVATVDDWLSGGIAADAAIRFEGDGAIKYAGLIRERLAHLRGVAPVVRRAGVGL